MSLCCLVMCVFCLCSYYRCKVCPLTFFSKSDMQIHSKTHTEAKAHKCPHCTKSFANASYLAQHLRIHLGVKPYRCSYCEKSFRQLSHLQQHTRSDLYPPHSMLMMTLIFVMLLSSTNAMKSTRVDMHTPALHNNPQTLLRGILHETLRSAENYPWLHFLWLFIFNFIFRGHACLAVVENLSNCSI